MKADDSSRVVLDASVAVAWCFEDEKTPYNDRLLSYVEDGGEAVVPSVWPLEVGNALLMAERRGRLTPAQSTLFLEKLGDFNIAMDPTPISRAFGRIFDEARQWNLTVYDAAYLELALRQGLRLATVDNHLKKAAKSIGVLLFT